MVADLNRALAWMHFHGIVHGNISNDSVLIRLRDEKPERILLVDYTTTRSTPPGQQIAVADMLADAQAVAKLVEDCCDIWAFRNGPTRNAQGEYIMQKRTEELMQQYYAIRRCSEDFFGRNGGSRESVKGVKLIRLQNKLGNAWRSAEAAQKQNLLAREIALLSQSKIKKIVEEWETANPPQDTISKQYMLLTLGHPVLDSLADGLHVKQWDTMPHEVCASIKEAGGDVEEPWQTFDVQKTTPIADLAAWLASCCEVHPEWRGVMETEVEEHLGPDLGTFGKPQLANLHNALASHGPLPVSMTAMFDRIANMSPITAQVEETYQVWYHIPSRMFNITQLQRLATPERLATTINDGKMQCNNFVEVRGDTRIEGCYVPLALLTEFASQLGLRLPQTPNLSPGMPTLNPADFSQVPETRIVLARPGLLGYGSMLRTGDQANFLYSRLNRNFVTPSAFLPTYFGDMKVIPALANGARTFDRPDDWSKYQTSKEYETAADLSRRRFLKATVLGVKGRRGKGNAARNLLEDVETDETVLGQLLRDREHVRAAARAPAKRNASWSSSPIPKRAHARTPALEPQKRPAEIPVTFVEHAEELYQSLVKPLRVSQPSILNASFLNGSFLRRNSALTTPAPNDPTNVNTSFTVGDEIEGLDKDWDIVREMLAQMPEDDEQHVGGVTGWQYDGSDGDGQGDRDGESDEATGVDSGSFLGRRGGVVGSLAPFTPSSKLARRSFVGRLDTVQEETRSQTESFDQSRPPWSNRGRGKGPAHNAPSASFKKHRRNVSDASDMSEDLPCIANSSPSGPDQQGPFSFSTRGISPFGSTGFGNSFGTQPISTTSSKPAPTQSASDDLFSSGSAPSLDFGFQPSRPPGLNPNRLSQSSRVPPTSTRGARAPPNSGQSFDWTSKRPIMDINASFSIEYPPTEAGSPEAHAPGLNHSFGANANASFGSQTPSTQGNSPETQSGGSPPIQNGIFKSPSAAINKFLRDQSGGQNKDGDGDSDMPDTESEGSARSR
jgi:hypothetical protein